MCTYRKTIAALACLAAVSLTSPAYAALVWNWSSSSAGQAAGSFETTGNPTDLLLSNSNFVIDIDTFKVTQSTFAPSLVGATFTETQPVQGLRWDGTKVTQFYRNNGSLTGGSNFYSGSYQINFTVNNGAVRVLMMNNNDDTGREYPVTLSAGTNAAVPEPATLALLSLGLAGLGAARRRQV